MSTARVLVVGAGADGRALAELLALHGFEVAEATARHAAGVARAWLPDCVVAEAALPEHEGRMLVDQLAAIAPRPRTIVISPRPSHALDALGVTCLGKPVDVERLLELAA
jgi:DNA-binding response OmpR family regulator